MKNIPEVLLKQSHSNATEITRTDVLKQRPNMPQTSNFVDLQTPSAFSLESNSPKSCSLFSRAWRRFRTVLCMFLHNRKCLLHFIANVWITVAKRFLRLRLTEGGSIEKFSLQNSVSISGFV